MANPTKVTVDAMTGEMVEVEMEGEELEAYLRMLAEPDPPLPRNPLEVMAEELEAAAASGDSTEIARTLAASLRKLGGSPQ